MAHPGNNRRRVAVARRPFRPLPLPPPTVTCQHPSRAELCCDYGQLINTGQMPLRLSVAKHCARCWYTVAEIMRRT